MLTNIEELSASGQNVEWGESATCDPIGQKVSSHITVKAGHETDTSLDRGQGLFETTRRVLACAVNDGLASATIETHTGPNLSLCIRDPAGVGETWIKCGLRASAYVERDGLRVIGFVRADDLLLPVLIRAVTGEISEERDPGVICRIISLWQSEQFSSDAVEKLVKEVRHSADNQVKWLEIARTRPTLHLKSPLSDWEQSVVCGHPTHPLHRACLAQPPLEPITPDDIPELLEPELSFISLARSDMKVFGPFSSILDPLLKSFGIPSPESPDKVVVPCFTRQLPIILQFFPNACHLGAVRKRCRAQISMRTLSLLPDVVPYHLKLSLNCLITSSPRSITPWSAAMGPSLSKALRSLLPPGLWIFEEVASITGGQDDFDKARHLTCIIRKSPEKEAEEFGETLIPVAGLFQKPFNDNQTYMEIMFGLNDLKQKQTWLRKCCPLSSLSYIGSLCDLTYTYFDRYLARLFSLVLPPLVRHGIGLESHPQNVLVRVNNSSKEVTVFAIRDFGGIRIHSPTFIRSGNDPSVIPSGAHNLTDDIHIVQDKVHHALFQVHVGHLLYMLGLESHGGWAIVREELERALVPWGDTDGRVLHDAFLKKTMSFKCFMEMRLRGVYRDYCDRELPNVLLRDM